MKYVTAHTQMWLLIFSSLSGLSFNWHVSIHTSHITVMFRFIRVYFALASMFQYVLYKRIQIIQINSEPIAIIASICILNALQ